MMTKQYILSAWILYRVTNYKEGPYFFLLFLLERSFTHWNVLNNNNNNIYLKSNIQCTYRYEFSGLYNNNIQLQ